MGFLDKLQQTAKETLDKGKEKLEDVQADRAADKLLRDLGAWYYAGRTGRDGGAAAEHIERIMGELQAHEAEHGELGAKDEPEPAAAPEAPAAAPAPPAADAPPAAAPAPPAADAPVAPAPSPPPVTPGPPPPPPA
jgi:hypothetical protein